jgi:hypothetical protein
VVIAFWLVAHPSKKEEIAKAKRKLYIIGQACDWINIERKSSP